MSDQQSSYRQIFKATSLFGGVQVFQILIGIIRVKFVAVLLGAKGVGISGLLNSPLELIISITGLGIAFSAVRDVSEAHAGANQTKVAKTIITLRRWSWFTGILGAVITLSFAPLISQWTFGDRSYTWAFVWLSVALLLRAISRGQSALLQGTRRLKEMAKAGVIGSVLGLITSIPLYYWFGIKGIVPAVITTCTTSLILSWHFSRKVPVEKTEMTFRETYEAGIGIAKLGISMTIAGFIASFSTYVLNAFISNHGGIEQVGFYNSGWGVIAQYTGPIFAAMATDYFPRLSAIHNDNNKIKELVHQQADTALLVLAPLLALLMIMMPFVVRILYTPEFLPIVMFANLTILGMQFKVLSWSMGYVTLAKGNGKLFLTLEIVSGILYLLVNLLFFYLFGLNGLGISFIINYLTGMLLTYFVLKFKYEFGFPVSLFRRLLITTGFVILSFLTMFIQSMLYRYIIGSIVIALASWYSLNRLNKLMDLKSYVFSRFRRK